LWGHSDGRGSGRYRRIVEKNSNKQGILADEKLQAHEKGGRTLLNGIKERDGIEKRGRKRFVQVGRKILHPRLKVGSISVIGVPEMLDTEGGKDKEQRSVLGQTLGGKAGINGRSILYSSEKHFTEGKVKKNCNKGIP